MACVKHFLLLLAAISVRGSPVQDVESTFTHLRENIKQDLQEFIKHTLAESDDKHAAQIATLREENELRIQQVKDELSNKYADDMAALRNDFETQNRDLRLRLEMLNKLVEQQDITVNDHKRENNRDSNSPDGAMDITNLSLDKINGSSKKPKQSSMVTKRNPKSAPISQISGRYSGNDHQAGNRLKRQERHAIRETRKDEEEVIGETRVAFLAVMDALIESHLGAMNDIIFQNAITNVGNAYNASSGTFIAPVDGVYVFSCTLMVSTRTYAHFVVNGNVAAKFYLNPGTNSQASHTIVVNLQESQSVSVHTAGADQTIYGDRFSTFGGFLLYEGFSNIPVLVG